MQKTNANLKYDKVEDDNTSMLSVRVYTDVQSLHVQAAIRQVPGRLYLGLPSNMPVSMTPGCSTGTTKSACRLCSSYAHHIDASLLLYRYTILVVLQGDLQSFEQGVLYNS